jgi:hypothetical protein
VPPVLLRVLGAPAWWLAWGWATLVVLVGLELPSAARADGMGLALSRLSTGDCASTLEGASDFALDGAGGAPALTPDRTAYAVLASALAPVTVVPIYAPLGTRGARSFALALDTQLVGLPRGSDALARGTLGSAPRTCDGRNGHVARALLASRIVVEKGLPLGLALGAMGGRVHGLGAFVAGAYGKVGLIEGFESPLIPDLGLRLASSALAGGGPLGLFTWQADLTASKRLRARRAELAPFVGASLVATRASTVRVDLTPNIDALGCARGTDPVCAAAGLSGSSADFAHERTFPTIWIGRVRAHAGASLGVGPVLILVEAGLDLVRPSLLSGGASNAGGQRVWHVSIAPALVY